MNSVNLIDVLPWGDNPPISIHSKTTLLCDSVETDGRFMLYTMAFQCLSPSHTSKDAFGGGSSESTSKITHVVWINCGIRTDDQIRSAMKKIGCDVRSSNGLDIVNVNFSFSHSACVDEKSSELYLDDNLKTTFQKVSCIVKEQKQVLIIVDDATTLSNIYGVSKTLGFLQSLRSLLQRQTQSNVEKECSVPNGLVIRISHDFDQEQFYQSQAAFDKNVTGNQTLNYIGAGGRAMSLKLGVGNSEHEISMLEAMCAFEFNFIAWERILVEIADGIVDVLPLSSGFSKDVHGRLIFTQRLGGNCWKDGFQNTNPISSPDTTDGISNNRSIFSTNIVNYFCNDAGVRAIRLRV